MPYELLENGNIEYRGGAIDPINHLRILAAPIEIPPGDRNYELSIRWLSDGDAERARAILADYRRSHAQAS